jgi:hypothetical protein
MSAEYHDDFWASQLRSEPFSGAKRVSTRPIVNRANRRNDALLCAGILPTGRRASLSLPKAVNKINKQIQLPAQK